jgi:GNAT superfamily N-acetyltransferase
MHAELVELPTFYATPGFIFLATDNDTGRAAGCVAMRALDVGTGEVRRLYVDPDGRSTGLGRLLVNRPMDEASAGGVTRLVLNTLPTMTHARSLYRDLGFTPIAPYVADPTEGVQYFGRDLP